MWDCKHRRAADEFCDRRRATCFPGGVRCVLKGRYEFPAREQVDPLLKGRRAAKPSIRKE